MSSGRTDAPTPFDSAGSGDQARLDEQGYALLHGQGAHPATDPAAAYRADDIIGDDEEIDSLADVKQLGLIAGIFSLGWVFWCVGAMEMIERLAYYGVKAVASLYAKAPQSSGGLGITMSAYGTITSVWAFTQSFVPVVTGGLSDRFGYKQTIFLSTIVKIFGYLIMAFFPNYGGFFVGAIVLATGTAI